VLGGEFVVQLTPGRRVRSVLGEAVPDRDVDTTPELSAAAARDAAIARSAKAHRVPAASLRAGEAALRIFDPSVLGGPGPEIPRLVYEVLVESDDGAIGERVFVDADRGDAVATFSSHHEAKVRTVCDAGNTVATSVPPNFPCTAGGVIRSEGEPPIVGAAATDGNAAYDFAGLTYDFLAQFGRDSLDGAGLPLRSTVRYCDPDEPCPYENAFWDAEDRQMTYGAGFAAADDVVGHELAHGLTDFTSGLYYYFQSGAINESLSDVFGELVDQRTPDAPQDMWLLGEDLAIGAIRDMENPPAFNHPDRMGSPLYTDSEADSGGVHTNSGVNNKAAYLIATAVGVEKVGHIYYRVATAYLTSASDYLDLGTALPQACSDLVGQHGIVAADCAQVDGAVAATEMTTNTRGITQTPPCDTPVASRAWLSDDLETPGALTRWVPRALIGTPAWFLGSGSPYGDLTYATSGVTQLFGDDRGARNDAAIEQATPVAIRPGARLVFRHAYGFEDNDPSGTTRYDGGVVEYTTGTGPAADWQPLPGVAYPGTITVQGGAPALRNPLEGRPAFVNESRGYLTSVTPLATLENQSVRFRFRVGSDATGAGEGWHIDDISVTICDGTPPETTITGGPGEGQALPSGAAPAFTFASSETDGAFECRIDGAPFGDCPAAFQASALAAGTHTLTVRARDFVGNVDPTPSTRSFTVAAPPGPPPLPPPGGTLKPPPAPKFGPARKPTIKGRTVTFVLNTPSAGRVRVAGTARVPSGRRTRTRTLGAAEQRARTAGRVTVKLTLNRTAVGLLRRRALNATFTATFRPAAGKATTVTSTLRLARTKPKRRR
jgi:hypothetical protein